MSNLTLASLCIVIICGTVCLCQPKPVVEVTPPIAVITPAPLAPAPVAIVAPAAPESTQRYNRLPNGELVPVVEETPQQFEQANTGGSSDPLAVAKDPKHHTTQELIDSVNQNGL